MRIAIEARALTGRGGGTRRYVSELTDQLRRLVPENELVILDRGPAHELLLPWWFNVTMPRRLRKTRPDIIHWTKGAVSKRKIAPTVVTIYDVIPLLFSESQKLTGRWYWPRALRGAVRAADHILTISDASKRDIVRELGAAEHKITVTPLAIDPNDFHPTRATDFVGQIRATGPYILFVGTIEPRKNVPLLIRAFARIASDIPHQLIIAGRAYKGEEALRKEIARMNLTDRVRRIGSVPAADLPALYASADLFMWPSIYEGWGFPPQEAMACGVPVIVSDGGSLPEVVGEAGKVVSFSAPLRERIHDTDFERRLAETMLAVLGSETRRVSMREAGLARVKQFSWQRVAEQTLGVYQKVLSEGSEKSSSILRNIEG